MTIKEIYYKGLDKLNKLVSNNQQDVPFHIFVLNFNEAQLHWVKNVFKTAEVNKTDIHNLQELLVLNKELQSPILKNHVAFFNVPNDYMDYSSSSTVIDECPKLLENNLIESANAVDHLKNPDWQPSLQFEETIVTVAENKIAVYYNEEFTPKKVLLNYFKYPTKVNMKDGFKNFDGVLNLDINPIWQSDDIIEEILDLTVKQISGNYGDEYTRSISGEHITTTQFRI